MSSNVLIKATGVCKSYHIYNQPVDRLKQILCRGKKQFYREYLALNDVSFEVKRGEVLGIVGRNGSGKSTLLQIICGTLTPSKGEVMVKGRVAALLELGAGFNPEFTGRENIYLNAVILGLSKDEINAQLEDILTFADIGEYIDQPVKTYSSGMYMRLAYSIAISIDPDVLVIDEALAVGDEAFQRKCFSRIEKIRDNGAAILFVSHSANIIVDLCSHAIFLDHGEMLLSGKPNIVVPHYQKLAHASKEMSGVVRDRILQLRDGVNIDSNSDKIDVCDDTDILGSAFDNRIQPECSVWYEPNGAEISDVMISDEEGHHVNCLNGRGNYTYSFNITFSKTVERVRFAMLIKMLCGTPLGGMSTGGEVKYVDCIREGKRIRVEFSFCCLLQPGTYFMNAGVLGRDADNDEVYLHRGIDVFMFKVMANQKNHCTSTVDFLIKPTVFKL